jgi:hypothetical protein
MLPHQSSAVQANRLGQGQPGEVWRAHAMHARTISEGLVQLQAAGRKGKTLEAEKMALLASVVISTKAFKEAVSCR